MCWFKVCKILSLDASFILAKFTPANYTILINVNTLKVNQRAALLRNNLKVKQKKMTVIITTY